MKWYVMIFFLSWNEDGTRNTFVFTKPTYNTEAECRTTLTDRTHIMKYMHGLMMSYGGTLPGPVDMVNCIDQNEFNRLQDLMNKKGGKIDT
mgnify:CR=1 FL=1|tara:strand:- start:210 stop:482 length:273 start_codon:yes stop_codon:yes gene_type:complete